MQSESDDRRQQDLPPAVRAPDFLEMRDSRGEVMSISTPVVRRSTLWDRALLAVRIGLGVLLLASFIFWVMTFENSVFVFQSILSQIRFENETAYWWTAHKHGMFSTRTPMLASGVLLVVSLFYRELKTAGGLFLLAVMVNGFACGYSECEFAPPMTLLFDILLLRFALQQFRGPRLPVPGICHVCGYDLRATPTRCPECGTNVFVFLKR